MATIPNREQVLTLIRSALSEDGADNDRTARYLGLGAQTLHARISARQRGVIAGLGVARWVFEEVDQATEFKAAIGDGDHVDSGDTVATVAGSGPSLLVAERVALNFLARLSGVSTLTARFVERVEGSGVRILDTRKTTPLFRELERYAVRVGGGDNHRFNLMDMILIKENHIRAAGGGKAVIRHLHEEEAPVKVEVEADSLAFVHELLGAPVDRIMLDNFSPQEVREAVASIAAFRAKHPDFAPEIEVSGGVDIDNVADYAIDGVDFISIGAITHSAPALDVTMEVE